MIKQYAIVLLAAVIFMSMALTGCTELFNLGGPENLEKEAYPDAETISAAMTAYNNGVAGATIDNGTDQSDPSNPIMKFRNSDNTVKNEYEYWSSADAPAGGNGTYVFADNADSNGVTVNGTLQYYIVYSGSVNEATYVFSGTLTFSGSVALTLEYNYMYELTGTAKTYSGYVAVNGYYYAYQASGTVSPDPATTPPGFTPPDPLDKPVTALDPPTISPETGRYTTAQTVTITHAEADVEIYYSIDGSWFSDTANATLYTAPFEVTVPTTVIARAYRDGDEPSNHTRGDFAITTALNNDLIVNGDFAYGLNLWNTFAISDSGAAAEFSSAGDNLNAIIDSGGTELWHVGAYYWPRFLLEQGHFYQLQYKAWSDGERTIQVYPHEEGIDNDGDGGAYDRYDFFSNWETDVTTTPQTFSSLFYMEEVTNPTASLRIDAGIDSNDIFIDDISLTKYVPAGGNMIANGDFSYGFNLWNYWADEASSADEVFTNDGDAFNAIITDGTADFWNIRLRSVPRVTLEQGKYYKLEFTGWSDGERSIRYRTRVDGEDTDGDGEPDTHYNLTDTAIQLSTASETHTILFQKQDSDSTARIEFNLGGDNHDVHIDDVVLTEYTPVALTTTDVPDPELRLAISDAFGKPFSEITDMDSTTLDELYINVDDYSVSDLTGLELFSGLTHLSFDDTVIADYSVIAELKNLRNISLDNTQISDVSFLSNLTGLTAVDLDNNQIASLADLSELSHVTYLSVRSNPLSTNELFVIPTYFPDLWALRISNTYDLGGGIHPIDLASDFSALLDMLDDLSMLEYLSLNDFYFSDTQFSSLYTQVLEPRKLEWTRLYIEDSELTEASLPAIATLENLERLWLSANAISDLSDLTGLVNLSELGVAENEFSDLSPLQTLYENGSFANGGVIEIENCALDLTSGTANRNVVDFLINAGIDVNYLEGNTVN